MEIKIGIRHQNRELVIESAETADAIANLLDTALADGGVFRLTDTKGRQVLVPTESIGYVEIGEENVRPVGFGAV